METKDNKTIMYICTQMRYLRPKYIHVKEVHIFSDVFNISNT